MDMSLSKLQEIVEDRGAWCAAVHGVTKSQTRLRDWTTATAEICGIHPTFQSKSIMLSVNRNIAHEFDGLIILDVNYQVSFAVSFWRWR